MAITNNRPAFTFANALSGPNGITDHAANAGMIVITGAITNKALFALAGTIISFNNSINKSLLKLSGVVIDNF